MGIRIVPCFHRRGLSLHPQTPVPSGTGLEELAYSLYGVPDMIVGVPSRLPYLKYTSHLYKFKLRFSRYSQIYQ